MWARGPGEIAQLAESSPCKHKELSSNPQHRLKNKQANKKQPGLEELKTGPWYLLASQPTILGKF